MVVWGGFWEGLGGFWEGFGRGLGGFLEDFGRVLEGLKPRELDYGSLSSLQT